MIARDSSCNASQSAPKCALLWSVAQRAITLEGRSPPSLERLMTWCLEVAAAVACPETLETAILAASTGEIEHRVPDLLVQDVGAGHAPTVFRIVVSEAGRVDVVDRRPRRTRKVIRSCYVHAILA